MNAGVFFKGSSLGTGLQAALHLRTGIRVLELLHEGEMRPSERAADEVYEIVREAGDWSKILHHPDMTFSVRGMASNCPGINNSQILVTAVRDAVCDSVRSATGTRPAPPERGATVNVPLHVVANR